MSMALPRIGPWPKPFSDFTPGALFAFARHVMKFEELVELIAAYYGVRASDIIKEHIKPKGQLGRAREMVCFFAYRLWASPKGSQGHGTFNWIKNKMLYADKTGPYRAYRRIEARASDDVLLRDEINDIEQRLIAYLRTSYDEGPGA